MATQIVRGTVPWPTHLVDQDAARLAAKKTLIPGATDCHGTRIIALGDVRDPNGRGSTWIDVEVTT